MPIPQATSLLHPSIREAATRHAAIPLSGRGVNYCGNTRSMEPLMMTVRDVADRYRASTTFVTRAFAEIGFKDMTPDSAVTTAAVAHFEERFGKRIRAARPRPTLGHADYGDQDDDHVPSARPAWQTRQQEAHLIRIAHVRHSGKRNMRTMDWHKVLADDPGPDHAIDAAGTREGDPWRGRAAPGEYKFFDFAGPHAVCGARVKVLMGDEFVPEDEAAAAGQCPRCAELVAEGRGFRTSPHERAHRSYFCEAYLRVRVDGRIAVQECSLRDFHGGAHRTRDGATWDVGFDDFVPAPLDANRSISKAS